MAASLTSLTISHRRRQVRHVAIEQYNTPNIQSALTVPARTHAPFYSTRESAEPTRTPEASQPIYFYHRALGQKKPDKKHTRATFHIK